MMPRQGWGSLNATIKVYDASLSFLLINYLHRFNELETGSGPILVIRQGSEYGG